MISILAIEADYKFLLLSLGPSLSSLCSLRGELLVSWRDPMVGESCDRAVWCDGSGAGFGKTMSSIGAETVRFRSSSELGCLSVSTTLSLLSSLLRSHYTFLPFTLRFWSLSWAFKFFSENTDSIITSSSCYVDKVDFLKALVAEAIISSISFRSFLQLTGIV